MGPAITTSLILVGVTLICIILIHSTPSISSSSSSKPSVYDLLDDYNFPVGLLPQGIQDYDFNHTTGKFSIYYNRTCSFSLQNSYHVKYNPTFEGSLSDGRLFSLKGVYVRAFVVWKEVIEVLRRGDDLVFILKIWSYKFPIDYFEEETQCWCLFRCGGEHVTRKLKTRL